MITLIKYASNTRMLRFQKTLFKNIICPYTSEVKKVTNKLQEENMEPPKFFGSKAATWKAKKSRSGGADEALWFQPYVISGSLAIFLIYFCILREENDIDIDLEKKLFDRVEGLEEKQLIMRYSYNKENSIDNSDIENRLKELGVILDTN